MAVATFAIVAGWVLSTAAQTPKTALPLDPPRERGASITPAYEGWYTNADGSFSLLLGYYNRNTQGDARHPGRAEQPRRAGRARSGAADAFRDRPAVGRVRDQGAEGFRHQGAHVDDRRQRRRTVDSADLNKGYPITPFKELGMGNQPPVLAFSEGGAKFTGPPVGDCRHA